MRDANSEFSREARRAALLAARMNELDKLEFDEKP
jgi:hypothetical protein